VLGWSDTAADLDVSRRWPIEKVFLTSIAKMPFFVGSFPGRIVLQKRKRIPGMILDDQ
jgi:hypothetical protein